MPNKLARVAIRTSLLYAFFAELWSALRQSSENFLTELGYEVISRTSSKEALALLEEDLLCGVHLS